MELSIHLDSRLYDRNSECEKTDGITVLNGASLFRHLYPVVIREWDRLIYTQPIISNIALINL